jgi:flavin reductase (DIM6/NTAB) family NADH-FMN oxidoreductase RutF
MTAILSPISVLPDESEVEQFWQAGLRFTTGVSVITAGSGESVHGTTVSTLSVVSRRPTLISLCLANSSSLTSLVIEQGSFAVNMLAHNQEELARHFASPTRGQGPIEFAGIANRPGFGAGVPLLDGALCWLWCRFRRVVPAGDHQIVLAGVTAVEFGSGTPLLYFAGRLHPGTILDMV